MIPTVAQTYLGVWLLGQLMWATPMPPTITVAECNARVGEFAQKMRIPTPPGMRPNDVVIGCFAPQPQVPNGQAQ